MNYRAMAKHFIYEMSKGVIPEAEEMSSFTTDGKELSESQLDKFTTAFNSELEAMRQKLVKQNIIIDG